MGEALRWASSKHWSIMFGFASFAFAKAKDLMRWMVVVMVVRIH